MTSRSGERMGDRRILVVDDDEDVLQLVATILRRDGWIVDEAADVAGAREKLDAGSYDAVVSDIDLPDGDGVSLVPVAATTRPPTRVVMITGHTSYDHVVRALQAGAYGFLSKPVRKDELLSVVHRAVEAKWLEKRNQQLVARLAAKIAAAADILDIAREVSASLDLSLVLGRALDRTIQFLGGEAGSILLRRDDGGLEFVVVRGRAAPATLLGTRIPAGAGIAGWVVEHDRATAVNDVSRDPRYFAVAGTGERTRSVLACPLRVQGEVIGVLEVVDCTRGKFVRDDLVSAETLSLSIAAAIRNAEKSEDQDRRLEETRKQMVRAEKMASIGTIAAGVAHEINNPIGFINSNLQTLQNYLGEMVPAIEALRAAAPPDLVLAERVAKADLDFVLGDIGTLVRESLDGVKRVVKIVKDLKTFSHGGKGNPEPTDLNECVESAINLSRNETKYVADVVAEPGDLAHFPGRPTEITQVLVNLIVNAAHAIPERGTITVRTSQDDEWAQVEVSDTGCGISPENLSKIFDPFFTTKEPGKGTGLGLSLSYEIVERHAGVIDVSSAPERGTTFRVRFPRSIPTSGTVRPAPKSRIWDEGGPPKAGIPAS